ncbi:Crp/Fnr family transcriptional regulator [Maribacter sp. HTCC2170]|uniref:Crp/Fnr family transcriptional regulator n=1 Tax=Maribacter sp. (strain HTCC2170 / KCCM 42371) TaxID=313603 RepID=UPI00006AFCB2|nr:Crp/Fnr family transcriptional regulator [Maribacter sp. HTCC2170]EAR01347.1 transcriptional regulator, Crp family protein [Maribacter sp. HTCC2170]
MENDKIILREKLNEHYGSIFEEALINEIAEIGIQKKMEEGIRFIDIGDEITHIPLVIDGVIKIVREDDNGDEILLYFLEHQSTCAISFANCIHKKRSIFRGTVERDLDCILVPVDKIEDWLIKYGSWRVFMIDRYNERLLEMVEVIENLAFKKLDKRILKYLKYEAKLAQDKFLNITHQKIAHDLNTSRVCVSRILKKLERKGRVKLGRNIIIVA